MAGLRIRPDDDIRRIRNIWLGPKGYTWPFHATYTAWGLFLVIFIGVLIFEAITPMKVSVFPAWEAAISVLLATTIAGALDHDKPLRMLPKVLIQHLRSPRRRSATTTYKPTLRIRVRNGETNR